MSISDELMWLYYDLLTDVPSAELHKLRAEVERGAKHPMDVKMDLARRIVADFHGSDAGAQAAANFQRVFRDRQGPVDATEFFAEAKGKEKLARFLVYCANIASKAEAERLIKQGGVELDGVVVRDPAEEIDLSGPRQFNLRVGKHKFFKVVVR